MKNRLLRYSAPDISWSEFYGDILICQSTWLEDFEIEDFFVETETSKL
jgi:hypothetical protein